MLDGSDALLAVTGLMPHLRLTAAADNAELLAWQQSLTPTEHQWQHQPLYLWHVDDDAKLLFAVEPLGEQWLIWASLSTDSDARRSQRRQLALTYRPRPESFVDWRLPLQLMAGQATGWAADDWQQLTQGGWRLRVSEQVQPSCAADALALLPNNALSWQWQSQGLRLTLALTAEQRALWQSWQAAGLAQPEADEYLQLAARLLPLLRFYQQQWPSWSQRSLNCPTLQAWQQQVQQWPPLTLALLANTLPGLHGAGVWQAKEGQSSYALSNRPAALLPTVAAALGVSTLPRAEQPVRLDDAQGQPAWLQLQEAGLLLSPGQQPLVPERQAPLVRLGFGEAQSWCWQQQCVQWPAVSAAWPWSQGTLWLDDQGLQWQLSH